MTKNIVNDKKREKEYEERLRKARTIIKSLSKESLKEGVKPKQKEKIKIIL